MTVGENRTMNVIVSHFDSYQIYKNETMSVCTDSMTIFVLTAVQPKIFMKKTKTTSKIMMTTSAVSMKVRLRVRANAVALD